MLVKFSVRNYKQFKEKIVFDLSAGNYSFNEECVKGGVVKTALIYDQNGTGNTTKIHLAVNACGNPICFELNSEQVHDSKHADSLINQTVTEDTEEGVQRICDKLEDSFHSTILLAFSYIWLKLI